MNFIAERTEWLGERKLGSTPTPPIPHSRVCCFPNSGVRNLNPGAARPPVAVNHPQVLILPKPWLPPLKKGMARAFRVNAQCMLGLNNIMHDDSWSQTFAMRSRNREQSLSLFPGADQRNKTGLHPKEKKCNWKMLFPSNGGAQKHNDWKQCLAPPCSMFGHMFALVFPSPSILRCCSNEGVSPGLPQADNRKQLPGSTGWQAGYLVRRVLGPLADTRELTI